MLSLDPERLARAVLPVSTGWLLADCMEARGKQDLWTRQKPEVLRSLREQAVVQSAESSNRIEGVTVLPDRLRPLLLGKARPRDRSEEEVLGYRNALRWIFTRKTPPPVGPDTIRHLHALCQGGQSGDAGRWKERDNEIQEVLPDGSRSVRFRATTAKETPAAMKRLCGNLSRIEEEGRFPALLADLAFVFDLSCVHPFRDGNGRVCRLATVLLLQRHGFEVGRYVSLERLVEESKEGYYEALRSSSEGWHAGRNDLLPWWNFSLTILRRAYEEFRRHVERAESSGKTELVLAEVERQVGRFALADLSSRLPSVSRQMVKKVLAGLKAQGRLRLQGRGRGARWERIP